jgi:hypothetical protein
MEPNNVTNVVETLSNENIKEEKESMNEDISTQEISILEITDLSTKLNELYRIIANGELKSAYLPQTSPMG